MKPCINHSLLYSCLVSFAFSVFSSGAYASEDLTEIAASCSVCHVGYLALTAKSHDHLVKSITAIRNKTAIHPPISIDHLGDAEIDNLVRILKNAYP